MNTINHTFSSNSIATRKVSFTSDGIKIAGNLYLPAMMDAAPRPALVVSHPGTGVKEQTAGLYARLLAERGFITLAFDAAYQGESEGFPRGLENPSQRVEDIKSAVSFLSTLPEVDAGKTGVLGICASGGYGIMAAATDHRIKAVATVSGVDVGRMFRNGADGKQSPDVIQQMLDLAAQDRRAVAAGKEEGSFPLFPETEEQAKAQGRYAYEGWKYYCTSQGQHPRSAKTFTWSSVEHIAGFDAFRFVDMIAPRPLLIIAGSEADTLWMAQEAFSLAKEPKALFIVEGASHTDLYHQEEAVIPAVDELEHFFNTKL
ncbi:alpha/beta hydrolase [Chitinophaga varians]|uniref:Alpha/beta hydrolase n=1 Tax=Chitinophaga varians TaxID=2202339 RepID=A0A847S468_9BACT|nr:alpha/beta hydrolase [Chitinophaga varians]NLR66321.1 alpha/beta hydrolase [Chitinophaga varians]